MTDRLAQTHPALLDSALCRLVGIDYPIVQTGMGFVSDARLTAATSAAGGLGIVAAAMMSLPELERAVADVHQLTDRPFGVNLRSDAPDVMERARLLVDANVRVASFALAPDPKVVAFLKEAGVICIPSIGAVRHAVKVAQWGVDAVVVQGGEGGGHTGAVPTSVLLPQIVDAIDIPVIAAGGFCDGRGLVAALAYGAAGIAMGTRFLLTSDSPVPRATKEAYLQAGVGDTVVTSAVDGAPHRMIRTPLVDSLADRGRVRSVLGAMRNAAAFKRLSGRPWQDIARQGLAMRSEHDYDMRRIVMAANAPMLCRAAMVDGDTELGILSAGQVVGLIDDLPSCAALIEGIIDQATSVLIALNGQRR